MGFVEKFGAAFGFGIAELQVTLDEPGHAYGGGDIVKGVITTKGGKLDETGTLTVALFEHWTETVHTGTTPSTANRYRYHNETLLVENLLLKAGEAGPDYRFALTMIFDGNLGHDWGVIARFEAPHAATSVCETAFIIAPPPVIAGLSEAVKAVMPFQLYQWYNYRSQYHLEFHPTTAEVKDKFDALLMTVNLNRDEDALLGELIINPQEHTLSDHLQSLLQTNNRTLPLSLSAAETAKGAEGATVALLRDLLESASNPTE
jgi:sporulation-control protein spo0M